MALTSLTKEDVKEKAEVNGALVFFAKKHLHMIACAGMLQFPSRGDTSQATQNTSLPYWPDDMFSLLLETYRVLGYI